MSVPTNRIIEYADSINTATNQLKQKHTMDPDTAERMLLDAECLAAALTAYLFKQAISNNHGRKAA